MWVNKIDNTQEDVPKWNIGTSSCDFLRKKQSQIRLLLFGKLRIICGHLFFLTEVIGYYRRL
jgi:hypothetical protein